MKILVTGASGFIGSHTVDLLLQEGHDVVGVDDLSTGKIENLQYANVRKNFTFVESDISGSKRGIHSLVGEFKPDSIIHLAALVSVPVSVKDPSLNFELNIRLIHEVLESARLNDVRRIVFASSAAVYGSATNLPLTEDHPTNPITPYGTAKLFGEHMLRSYFQNYGIEYVAFRYFNVYGPRQDPKSPYSGVMSIFVDRLRASLGVEVFGDGQQTRDFISVSDVARFNSLALNSSRIESGTYNLCTGKQSTLMELLDCIASTLDVRPDVCNRPSRAGDIRHSVGCNRKLGAMFNTLPTTTLETGISSWISDIQI